MSRKVNKSSVDTMISALRSTTGLNAKCQNGCRYLQQQLFSAIIKKSQETSGQITWEAMDAALTPITSILRNPDLPLWARKALARFFMSWCRLPLIDTRSFCVQLNSTIDLADITKLQKILDSKWDRDVFPTIIQEEDRPAAKRDKEASKKNAKDVFAKYAQAFGDKEYEGAEEVGKLLQFVSDNFEEVLAFMNSKN